MSSVFQGTHQAYANAKKTDNKYFTKNWFTWHLFLDNFVRKKACAG